MTKWIQNLTDKLGSLRAALSQRKTAFYLSLKGVAFSFFFPYPVTFYGGRGEVRAVEIFNRPLVSAEHLNASSFSRADCAINYELAKVALPVEQLEIFKRRCNFPAHNSNLSSRL